jgi:hypothetical protein
MRVFAACLSALLLSACIVEAPSSEDGKPGATRTVRPAGPVTVKTGALLGDQVELVGATFNPGELIPGQPLRVTLYFRALAPLSADYAVFVHVEDADGRLPRTNFDHPPAGGKYPTRQWKKGDLVRDEFTIYLAPEAQARAVNLLVGLWDPKTEKRLPLTNPQKVRNDGQSRVLLARIPVAHF